MTRRERYIALCEEYFGETPTMDGGHVYSGTEDAAEYLHEDKWDDQYVLVTSGGEHQYLYPLRDMQALTGKLEDVTGDLVFGEAPYAVENLDTGETLYPQWATLKWAKLGK